MKTKIGFLFTFVLLGISCGKEDPAIGLEESFPAPTNLAHKLAMQNKQGNVPDDHPTVVEFNSRLQSLSQKCHNNPEEIADVAYTAHKLITQKGVHLSLLQVLREIDQMIPLQAHSPQSENIKTYATEYFRMKTRSQ